MLKQGRDLDEVLLLVGKIQRQMRLEPLLKVAEDLTLKVSQAGIDISAVDGLPGPPPLAGPSGL